MWVRLGKCEGGWVSVLGGWLCRRNTRDGCGDWKSVRKLKKIYDRHFAGKLWADQCRNGGDEHKRISFAVIMEALFVGVLKVISAERAPETKK